MPSYRALKAWREERKASLLEVVRAYSAASSEPELKRSVEDILSGASPTIPVPNRELGAEFVRVLETLGGSARFREMENACQCPSCNTFTVVKVGEDPTGYEAFACCTCLELKRACPACGGQGWLLHYRADAPGWEGYICDECCYVLDLSWRPIDYTSQSDLRRLYDRIDRSRIPISSR
jgi:hypothetical protein